MIRLLSNAPLSVIAMLLGSVVGCGYTLVQMIRVMIAARWPTAEGEILSAYLVQNGFDTRGLYERVTYRHDVGGVRFVNDRAQPNLVVFVIAAASAVCLFIGARGVFGVR